MRKSFVLFALLPIVFSCNNKPSVSNDNNIEKVDSVLVQHQENQDTIVDDKPSRESLSAYFTEDKSGDKSWIQVKNALSADETGIYVYFQTEYDVAKNLRMRMQYADNTSYKFIVDGKSYNYKANRSKGSDARFVDGGVSWYDGGIKRDDLKFLEALAASKDAKVVLSDGSSQTISNQTKVNIKRTLDYFESLDGLLPKSNMVNIRRL